nr:MAG TPA: hypothetical protein [Caudoviricetes sp.]
MTERFQNVKLHIVSKIETNIKKGVRKWHLITAN